MDPKYNQASLSLATIKSLLLVLMVLVTACTNDTHPNLQTNSGVNSTPLPHFDSVFDLLTDNETFNFEEGTLAFLSEDGLPVHVQVSGKVFDGDSQEKILTQVKRNVVFVSYLAFSQTDIEQFTITSVPLKMLNAETSAGFLETFEQTEFVNRKTAVKILEKYLGVANFKELYRYHAQAGVWTQSNSFNLLQNDFLPYVYGDLVK